MTREKYEELRKKRLKEREERFKRTIERIKEQNRLIQQRKWAELEGRKRIKAQLLWEKKLEQEKAREAITNAKAAIEEVEEKTKASLYVPEITKKINEMLTEADKSFDLAEYEKAIKLSFEIEELAEKARLEASRKAEEKKRRRKKEGKYFYCVIPFSEEKSFGNIGMNNNEVYTIPYRDVAAIVSDSPMKDYELTEDNTRRHETVLRQVMEEHTVVPVEFGTTIKNERILRRLLRKAYDPTRECLKLVDNMVELGVKAVLNEDIVFVDHGKRKECISDILGSLNTRAKQAVTGDLFSDRLFLNASFLVNKEDINAFSNEVKSLQEKYPMLKLLYSGPWAPYNFVYIKIGAEGMGITKK
ncbi:MAG: Gas vesicle synthesis protein GvpL/GvpF [Candidatus Bathyarchaeota archaeon BA2]|nr:MAG: Gas vesicle synthesis protein GvpL/GvpF [Candidatus Bathyarchaeota archaeon BA2]